MFESSLIDLEAKQHPRRKWAPLPIAVALHGIVLASVGVAQVWNVAAVNDPETVAPFHVLLVPSLPASGSQPHAGHVQKPATTTKPIQPDTRELPDKPVPDTTPEVTNGPLADNPTTGEGDDSDIDIGPSNGPFNGPGPVDGPSPATPAAAPVEDEILTVGGAVTRPVLLSGRQPQVPEILRHARIEGAVILQAVIDERGHVTNLRVLRGLPMGIDQAAVEAVQTWLFEPARFQGRPVKVHYTLTVNFQLGR